MSRLIARVCVLCFITVAATASAAPLVPLSAVSRKHHEGVDDFDIPLPLTGPPGVECREASGNFMIVVHFPSAVTFTAASVTTGTGTVDTSSTDGADVTINLMGVWNAQRITVSLLGASDGTTTNDVSVPMNVLLGDTTGDGRVNSSDVSYTQFESGHLVTEYTFRTDVNRNGSINSSDVSTVQFQSGTDVNWTPPSLDRLSTGVYSASLALEPDGSLWSWGSIPGDGSQLARAYPLASTSVANPVSSSCGSLHSAILAKNGVVWAWGGNPQGQLGDGTGSDSYLPLPILSNVIAVRAGGFHTLALLQNGTVFSWGKNNFGQLGNDSTTGSWVPIAVSNLTGVTQIAAGYERSLALKSDGTLWSWGFENDDPDFVYNVTPVQVAQLTQVKAISAGRAHAAAVKSDGTVWAWGNNDNGQVGNPIVTGYTADPVQVQNLSSIVAVSSSYDHTLALTAGGAVWAWGANESGELGNGTTNFTSVPVQVSGLTDVVAITAAQSYSMAMKSDGTVWAWGYDNALLGVAPEGSPLVPRQVILVPLDGNGNIMDDRWEIQYFGNLKQSGDDDFDADGLSNVQEFLHNTNPAYGDTDNDGVSDGEEVAQGADPTDPTSYPPRIRGLFRALWYHWTPSGYNGQPYGNWHWWCSWSDSLNGSGEWYGPKKPLTSLSGELASRVPFLAAIPLSPPWELGGGFSTSVSLVNDDVYGASVEQQRLWFHRSPSRPTEARLTILLVKRHQLNDVAQPLQARAETLVIPAGGTISDPIDSLNQLTQDFDGLQGYHSEWLDELAYPIVGASITFFGNKYWELTSDNSETEYSAPHFYDADGNFDAADTGQYERNYSVAFTRNTKPKIGATFKIQDISLSAFGDSANDSPKIRAHGSDGIEIPATTAVVEANFVTLPLTESTTPLPDAIKYCNKSDGTAFELTWEMSVDGGSTWVQLATTKHTVYVTLGDPSPMPDNRHFQETLFFIGCKFANGLTSQADMIGAVWTEFEGRQLYRVDHPESPLTYYANNAAPYTTCVSLDQMLAAGDGRCGCFQGLMLQILYNQGVSAAVAKPTLVTPHPDYRAEAIAAYMAEYGEDPRPTYPTIRNIFFVKNWDLNTKTPFSTVDQDGAPAQGNSDPIAVFADHALVEVNLPDTASEIYDPSYGTGPFGSIVSWQDNSLAGFGVQFIDASQLSENFVLYVGKIEETGVQDVNYEDL